MPDAFENYNTAIRSMLTANAVADNEEPYYPFADLAPIGTADSLSPYGGSQGNASVTSPMSTSSSPMHMDDYINLNNTSALGEPYISILVQPMDKFRFRYKSEMVGTHGSLLGISSGRRRNKNNVPTVQLCNAFMDRAVIQCSLVTIDDDHRIPHAHRLVRRVGTDDEDDPHDIEVSMNTDFTAEFNNMGIIHTARRNVKEEIARKLRARLLEKYRQTQMNPTLSVRDEAQIKAEAEQYQKCINLNSVALCFQAFIKDDCNILRPITAPAYSNSINNLKSALTGELKICRIDKYTSSCDGGEEVFMLVEKVSKKNIRVKFFELNDNDIEIWVDYGRFSELDVHHQYAMVFKTPPYRDLNITSPREVFIQLERPSDLDCSEPIKFTYKPNDRIIGRKRTRVSHSDSAELAQAILNQDTPPMNVSLTNVPFRNDSSEMAKEIKKMLEDRCSSSELRECLEDVNLELLESYINTYRTDDNLAFDGASSKKDAESFAEDIVMDILKKIQKMKQSDARNTVMTLLNDRTIYGDSPLHCALRYGQKAVIKRILMLMSTLNSDAQDLTNISNGSGKTPLHYAVLQNQPEVTNALLMLGANPNISDHSGQTPLHVAASYPEAGSHVDILLNEGNSNFEMHTDLGWTPLQLAAEAGSYYAVRSLTAAGAEVNKTEMSYGRTALHIAVEGGHKGIVEYLLKHTKIDVNKKNFNGNTALHTAVVTQGAKAREICALLMKYGADPYIRNNSRSEREDEIEASNIKVEADSDDGADGRTGESSFDLASNKLDILQLISGQGDPLSVVTYKEENEENIIDTEKVWMDSDQEKRLAAILDETKGWKKLADYLQYDYLLKTFEQSSSATLLLLSYIAVQTQISLGELQGILQHLDEGYAAAFLEEVLSSDVRKQC